MTRERPRLTTLWHALDEAAFGAERTLNLRELLPSAAEARARTEVWLRARQVTRAGDVLVITGRGNQSIGGIGVVRREILEMLPSLRRRGIVESWKEHSPGSIVVKLASVSALLDAPRRRRDKLQAAPLASAPAIEGLEPETVRALRELAMQNLGSLGVVETDQFIEQEMARTFSALIAGIPDGSKREEALRNTIKKAIEEVDQKN